MPQHAGEGAACGLLMHCFHMSQNLYGCDKITEEFVHAPERREDAFFD
jgi:hypothetical protein